MTLRWCYLITRAHEVTKMALLNNSSHFFGGSSRGGVFCRVGKPKSLPAINNSPSWNLRNLPEISEPPWNSRDFGSVNSLTSKRDGELINTKKRRIIFLRGRFRIYGRGAVRGGGMGQSFISRNEIIKYMVKIWSFLLVNYTNDNKSSACLGKFHYLSSYAEWVQWILRVYVLTVMS